MAEIFSEDSRNIFLYFLQNGEDVLFGVLRCMDLFIGDGGNMASVSAAVILKSLVTIVLSHTSS